MSAPLTKSQMAFDLPKLSYIDTSWEEPAVQPQVQPVREHGFASWLAAPGSSGSAEYASADAVAVFSAATRNPRQIMEDLTGMLPGFADHLREFQAKTGVNAINDIAAALGTDFTI